MVTRPFSHAITTNKKAVLIWFGFIRNIYAKPLCLFYGLDDDLWTKFDCKNSPNVLQTILEWTRPITKVSVVSSMNFCKIADWTSGPMIYGQNVEI